MMEGILHASEHAMNALAAPFLAAFLLTVPLLAVPLLAVPAGASGAEITVSAAASLKEAFSEAAEHFRRASGVTVHLNFASSNTLLRQLRGGAPADVLATADQATMDEAADPAGGTPVILPATRRDFAANQLVLITPAGGTAAPGLDALRAPSFSRIAMGSPESVPAGRYAREAMTAARVWDALAPRLIFGNNVRQVLAYVQRGEADAGIVYRTDALRAGNAVRIDCELQGHTPVTYPIAVTAHSTAPEEARRFLDYVLSPAGQETLARHGFSTLR
jgi:molybdate transport system substrate-binding protein